jgi:HlyD family secretion protein
MKQDSTGKELAEIISRARPGHPVWQWLVLVLILALAALGYLFYSHRDTGATGPVFTTEPLERGDIDLTITATGNLAPTNQVTIGSELSGTIAEVYVDTNDAVKQGQPLAKLDTSKLASQTERNRAILLSANARVALAEATLAETTATLGRFQDLHRLSGGKTPSKADMDAALATVERSKAELESARAAVAEAGADLRSVERDLSKTIIRSPVDGIVLTRSVEVGQTVAATFTAPVLFLIAEDLRKMDLVVTVAEADIGRVADGQPASFTVDAWPSRIYNATVKRVAFGSVIANNVVTYNTELEVANDDLSLRPGMTATADISVAKCENALFVRNAALRFDPAAAEALAQQSEDKRTLVQSLAPSRRWRQKSSVPKIKDREKGARIWTLRDGEAVEVPVNIGITDGRVTEITGEGLAEGMPVILSARPPAAP